VDTLAVRAHGSRSPCLHQLLHQRLRTTMNIRGPGRKMRHVPGQPAGSGGALPMTTDQKAPVCRGVLCDHGGPRLSPTTADLYPVAVDSGCCAGLRFCVAAGPLDTPWRILRKSGGWVSRNPVLGLFHARSQRLDYTAPGMSLTTRRSAHCINQNASLIGDASRGIAYRRSRPPLCAPNSPQVTPYSTDRKRH
jgi:hypothetical protein